MNLPMQYIGIFYGIKKDIFLMKNQDIFLIFAQNTDCGNLLEPPQCGSSNNCPSVFSLKWKFILKNNTDP